MRDKQKKSKNDFYGYATPYIINQVMHDYGQCAAGIITRILLLRFYSPSSTCTK